MCKNLGTQTVATRHKVNANSHHSAYQLRNSANQKWKEKAVRSMHVILQAQFSRLKQIETHTDRLINPHSHTAYKHLDRYELSSRLRKVCELQVSSPHK